MTIDALIRDASFRLAGAREVKLQEQLNFLIKQGVLIVEEGPMVLTQIPGSHEVMFSQVVDLKVRDQQRLQELVYENETLKEKISKLIEEG